MYCGIKCGVCVGYMNVCQYFLLAQKYFHHVSLGKIHLKELHFLELNYFEINNVMQRNPVHAAAMKNDDCSPSIASIFLEKK